MQWQLFEYATPIVEFKEEEDTFTITGTAISETTTHNGHKYIAEELEKASSTLINKPLLVDHDNRIESIKGRVVNSRFDNMQKRIVFEAKVMDEKIKEMIADGRINSVSIGAFAEDLIKEEDGTMLAKGIQIKELSLVAVPADENATFHNALDKSFQIKESLQTDRVERRKNDMQEVNEELNSVKEQVANLQAKEKEQAELIAEYKKKERNALESKYEAICKEKDVKAKSVKEMSDEVLTALIEQVSEIVVKTESKSVVKEETEQMDSKMLVERSLDGSGYSFFMMPDSSKKGVIDLNGC